MDKRLLKKKLRGYQLGNKFSEAERRAWLAQLTSKEAWAIFDDLYDTWEQMGKKSGGNWAALEKRRIQEKIALRRAFRQMAQRRAQKGL